VIILAEKVLFIQQYSSLCEILYLSINVAMVLKVLKLNIFNKTWLWQFLLEVFSGLHASVVI
jgi:hypothetical protein